MAKDYAKFVPPKNRTPRSTRSRFGLIITVLLLIVVLAAAAVFFYLKTVSPQDDVLLAKITAAVVHKKATPEAVKSSAAFAVASNNQPPPVQFKFYNQLPNPTMQVSLPDTVTVENSQPLNPSTTPVIAINTASTPKAKKIEPEVQPLPNAPAAETTVLAEPTPTIEQAPNPAPAATPIKAKPVIFDPEEVSNLLAAETTTPRPKERYEIHLGTFDTEQGARLLVEAVVSVGFQAEVIKINQGGHRAYRVQQGPYDNIVTAKSTQQRLQKRGIISVIRKT